MSNQFKAESDKKPNYWKADLIALTLVGYVAELKDRHGTQITYLEKSNYPSHMGALIRRTEDVMTKEHEWHKNKDNAIASLVAHQKNKVIYQKHLLNEQQARLDELMANIEDWIKPAEDQEAPLEPPTNIPHIPIAPAPYAPRYDDLDTVHGGRNLRYNPRPSRKYTPE